jgi:hypothetical protein
MNSKILILNTFIFLGEKMLKNCIINRIPLLKKFYLKAYVMFDLTNRSFVKCKL